MAVVTKTMKLSLSSVRLTPTAAAAAAASTTGFVFCVVCFLSFVHLSFDVAAAFEIRYALGDHQDSSPSSSSFSSTCFQCNTDFHGHDVRYIGGIVTSAIQCQRQCLDEPLCHYFTYSPLMRSCFLKSSNTGQYSHKSQTYGLVSGPKNCPSLVSQLFIYNPHHLDSSTPSAAAAAGEEEDGEGPPHHHAASRGSCIQCNTDFSGNSLRVVDFSTSFQRPQQQRRRQLAAYDFANVISSKKSSSFSSHQRHFSNYQSDQPDHHDQDISQLAPLFKRCKLLCDQQPLCTHFTYASAWQTCHLKQGNTDGDHTPTGTTDFGTIGLISFTNACFSPNRAHGKDATMSFSTCFLPNADYYGSDIYAASSVSTAVECQRLCQDHDGCEYFTFVPRDERCYLKYDHLSTVSNTWTNGFVSGPKYCPNHPDQQPQPDLPDQDGSTDHQKNQTCKDGQYKVVKEYRGNNFFNEQEFSFFTYDDPTRGIVNYVDRMTAVRNGLVFLRNGKAIIKPDTVKRVPQGARGRDSVRIVSTQTYDEGLWVLDLNHMPTGCGTWPAYWLVGDDPWPAGGEVDIMEGANLQSLNHVALHTKPGCQMWGIDETKFTGLWSANGLGGEARDCYYAATDWNVGCAVDSIEPSFGDSLNRLGGGVVVAEVHRKKHIRVWFFRHAEVPVDLKQPGKSPNPDSWTKLPIASFPLRGNCNGGYFFKGLRIVFNLTFCGGFSGFQFLQQNGCPGNGIGDCEQYVRNYPQAFTEAYWDINHLKVFQRHVIDPVTQECRVAAEDEPHKKKRKHHGRGGRENVLDLVTNGFDFMYVEYESLIEGFEKVQNDDKQVNRLSRGCAKNLL